ncbi:helix-turn-helix transcriptional regulator [Rhodospirillum centenum]|uniref:HTH araC/xylS-type domain-containing protein n=1 Tax=Rhodospirillum centenum (strain ATCC 51521 / SW) TaxID=414684 RepID=B6IVF7_RHOCS|nr:helix-turn-helix transcriptional regulator [Rhodospirillum centenum]ACJ00281.1 conserved hypothetical protein [Rhodospirillum centenum SW]
MLTGCPVIAVWDAAPAVPAVARVSPDGCRDLILRHDPGNRPFWFVSALEDRTCAVALAPGSRLHGFRMRPGLGLDAGRLLRALDGREPEPDRVLALVANHAAPCARVEEALAALAAGPGSIAAAAAGLGVTPRTLQRLLLPATGRTPGWWLMLARLRRAARDLAAGTPPADAAAEHGYADQAHLTRAVRRWLGTTPRGLRGDADLAGQLAQPGYG